MYAKGMKLPEGKKCAAFITVNLSAEFFWLSLDEKAADMPKTLSLGQYGMTHGLPRGLRKLIRKLSEKWWTEGMRLPATDMNMRIFLFLTMRSSKSASAKQQKRLRMPAERNRKDFGRPWAI